MRALQAAHLRHPERRQSRCPYTHPVVRVSLCVAACVHVARAHAQHVCVCVRGGRRITGVALYDRENAVAAAPHALKQAFMFPGPPLRLSPQRTQMQQTRCNTRTAVAVRVAAMVLLCTAPMMADCVVFASSRIKSVCVRAPAPAAAVWPLLHAPAPAPGQRAGLHQPRPAQLQAHSTHARGLSLALAPDAPSHNHLTSICR